MGKHEDARAGDGLVGARKGWPRSTAAHHAPCDTLYPVMVAHSKGATSLRPSDRMPPEPALPPTLEAYAASKATLRPTSALHRDDTRESATPCPRNVALDTSDSAEHTPPRWAATDASRDRICASKGTTADNSVQQEKHMKLSNGPPNVMKHPLGHLSVGRRQWGGGLGSSSAPKACQRVV
jgi:hypothetical protein